jgi:hypothetical protein
MPIVPNYPAPLPTVNEVMNVARSRVGDMLDQESGTLLTNDAPYAQTFLSSAWKWYQNKCANAGIELQIRETVLTGLPARSNNDTAAQCWITWYGCSDGVGQYDVPALPSDLVNPLSIWRREAGSLNASQLMSQATDGLPVWIDSNIYDWRENGLYYYGATYVQEFRIRYSTYWQDLDITQPFQQIPMRGCEDCLGARIAYEYNSARMGPDAAAGLARWAEDAFQETVQRTSRRKQRSTFRRKRYGDDGYGYAGAWPADLV